MNIPEKLLKIQTELKAPKNQFNSFGKYNYRSCEDILEGLKPLLDEYKATLIIADEIVQIGERYYVKATATLQDVESKEYIHTVAYAREDESKKGMDLAQVTGSTSSYARKYALNGLFAIDDTKDSDATNDHGKGQSQTTKDKPKQENQPTMDKEIVDGSLASDKQLGMLYALVKQKEYTPESMASYIKHNYNKDSSKALTKKEASEVIKMLQDIGK